MGVCFPEQYQMNSLRWSVRGDIYIYIYIYIYTQMYYIAGGLGEEKRHEITEK